ncbi:hypothetical protein [Hahella sp. HN01]|uniref:hypothetical protein n=1 Tax=Hahella sp. HN01 TaxID=2847262 RepID=UPI001C1EC560|nr:hypothetical protein [Hahella sp. HN01]MBU6954125.1 hypothetical protein [Hahella sp. HN01]
MFTTRKILLSVTVSFCFCAQAMAAEAPVVQEGYKEKSTLETFPLQSLDSTALSAAVIGGSLDAPAAGEETDAPFELKERTAQAEKRETQDEFRALSIPADAPQPRFTPVTPTTHIYDYLITTER